MKPASKRKIRQSLEKALNSVLNAWKISDPSGKTTSLIRKTSRKLSEQVKNEIKKLSKKDLVKKAVHAKSKGSVSTRRKNSIA